MHVKLLACFISQVYLSAVGWAFNKKCRVDIVKSKKGPLTVLDILVSHCLLGHGCCYQFFLWHKLLYNVTQHLFVLILYYSFCHWLIRTNCIVLKPLAAWLLYFCHHSDYPQTRPFLLCQKFEENERHEALAREKYHLYIISLYRIILLLLFDQRQQKWNRTCVCMGTHICVCVCARSLIFHPHCNAACQIQDFLPLQYRAL